MKIKVSYTEDEEARAVLALLRPLLDRFRVKGSVGKPPYRHLYFTPKDCGKDRERRIIS